MKYPSMAFIHGCVARGYHPKNIRRHMYLCKDTYVEGLHCHKVFLSVFLNIEYCCQQVAMCLTFLHKIFPLSLWLYIQKEKEI